MLVFIIALNHVYLNDIRPPAGREKGASHVTFIYYRNDLLSYPTYYYSQISGHLHDT